MNEKDLLYMQITYDLNELARFVNNKAADKLFDRIVTNLNALCEYNNPVEVEESPVNK